LKNKVCSFFTVLDDRNMEAAGHGSGLFSAGSRSLIGIGNTTALGYVHAVHEQIGAGGAFAINGRGRGSSFTSPVTGKIL